MRKLFSLLIACAFCLVASSQYWQQKLDYTIDVSLNDKEKTLDGFEKIIYTNNSPDTLHFIWFHLWMNAYKNDRTAFSDQMLENGKTSFYFSNKEEKGYINRLNFKIDGITASTQDHPNFIDVIKIILPKPLSPKQKIAITTPFHEKLPFNFSRGGYDGESFQITQWYPKPAVYDKNGWHPMPYLDQGEFYSEFGSFDVRITVPENYVVAATGQLQNEDEKKWLLQRKNFQWKPVKQKTKLKGGNVKTITQNFPASSEKNKTIQYKQDSVHDFAWFADKRFMVNADSCKLSSGKIVDVFSFYTSGEEIIWKNSVQFAKDALRFYSGEVGEYPYNSASVVEGPQSFGGGMEYPTITVISPPSSAKELDDVIAHELGHNWFYGILGSNEREHPWMDEGINTFYEEKYMQLKYGSQSKAMELLYLTKVKRKTSQPIETPSEKFSATNYFLSAYFATAAALQSLEKKTGKEALKIKMQRYFSEWKFKHPQPEDFKKILGAGNYDLYFNTPVSLNDDCKMITPFKKGSFKNYLQNPVKHAFIVSPAVGVNGYDQLMIGGLISNYKLPPDNLSYLAIPLYGAGSKKFTGLGKLNYTIMSDGIIRKTDIFLNASKFTMDQFTDTAGRKLFMQFQKLVPGVRFSFKEKKPASTVRKYIQWKTFLMNEQTLRIIPDTVISGADTNFLLRYLLPKQNSYINQLKFVYENHRSLYPFSVNVQIEQSKDFIRPTLTTNYFFNYREGGLQVRFFAGKFIYLGKKTIYRQFANDRYFLNMTGPKGYEDYTYSDYFVGRNKFEGAASQQIMIRDGAFKVRTDLLSDKIGKTDNWLTAINFSSSVPQKLNPLSVLPIKIPLKIFWDIGTYAEAWNRNDGADRFLFDAGLQIALFDEAINIYFPLLYNKVYSDYFKSTIGKNRFLKTISFSIHFYTKAIKRLNNEVEF